ncbi:hypothetical protein ACFL2Q_12890 [Thermodesulfobacteriota bacterium]
MFAQVFGVIVGVLTPLGFVALVCIFGRMRWGGALLLLYYSIYPMSVTLLLLYGNPLRKENPVQSLDYLYMIPVAVCVGMFILAVLTALLGKKENPIPSLEPSWVRLPGMIAAHIILLCGLVFFFRSIYSATPDPARAVTSWLVLSCLAVICAYVFSRMNSPNRPNLFRWLAFATVSIFQLYAAVPSVVMLFGFPEPQKMAELLSKCAALAPLGYLPSAIIIFWLARDYVHPTPKPKLPG